MAVKTIILPTKMNLERFISVHAHDLRSPYNQIIGFTKMTINTLGNTPAVDVLKEDLGTVYRSSLRAFTMMSGLVDIARIKRHEKGISLSDIGILPTLEQGLAQWKKLNPGLETQTDFKISTSSETMRADSSALQQIIAGFIAYVIQYSGTQAKVTINIEEEPDWFVFAFTSQGTKAIPPSEIDLQMLGYINRSLIELHQGLIRRAEENDEGAFIQFCLPKT